MKYYRAVDVLFFISLLCLHCLPNYCDIKEDALSASADGGETLQAVPTHPSRAQNVPTQQDENEKVNLGLENVPFVQPSVEYVNNELEKKESKQFVDQIGNINPLPASAENIKSSESSFKHISDNPDPQSVDGNKLEPTISESSSKSAETEPLSTSVVPQKRDGRLAATSEVGSTMPQEIHPASSEEAIAQQQYDGMPSFDEWKKMMLAEQQKGGQKVPSPSPPGKKLSSQKRKRNYSSYECGAKIVNSNAEAEGTSRILNELVDEYMLNPCKAKIWFIIELCETVQASQIELANFELFSSCPRDFAVWSSDNYPTRDWVPLGTFTAAEQRILQSFQLKQEGFGKFIKIELLSHYGAEHYCPLSVVRIFGTSMVDEYEEMETLDHQSHAPDDIPDDDLDRLDIPMEDSKSSNIFGSATDAVLNIVKKAAQALGQQQSVDDKKSNETLPDPQNVSESKICNVMDPSTHKCVDGVKEPLPPFPAFLGSPSSVQQSLFRLLYRCDQCKSQSIRYYSSAQPHCRFFQAALGPVMFQALCDWFRDHPLAIAHETPAPHQKDPPFVISPTKSPPPQIMRIPSDSDLTLKNLLNDTLSSVTYSEKNLVVNVTSIPLKLNKSASVQDRVVLQSSIRPTQTLQNGHSSSYNVSLSMPSRSSKDSLMPSADSVGEVLSKASVSVPEKTETSTKEIQSETVTVSISDYTTTHDLLTESEESQINEFLSDPSAVSTEDISIDIVPATELPSGFKSGEDKVAGMRSEVPGKLEPMPVAGSISAGQKESVFMRMSNRIKALEVNVSLSSQYLQELSQRYRRQMDEMQRAFNRTIGTLNDTARKAAEKDVKQQEVLNSLQLQVANLSVTVELLLAERSLVFRQMIETHVCLMFIEAIIMVTIMSLCVRRITSSAKQTTSSSAEDVGRVAMLSPSRHTKRRNSADSCTTPIARKVKKRSNSEENLNAEALIVEPLPVLLDPILKAKKKKKRNKTGLQRSVSHPHMQRNGSVGLSPPGNHNHSEGCVSANNSKSKRLSYTCENCDKDMCTGTKSQTSKERRINGVPLQNLTNGSVVEDKSSRKEKFSFKKFLKFQKRDSI